METEPALGVAGAPPATGGRRPRSRDQIVTDIAAEIAATAQKLVRDQASVADMKLLNAALKELRYAFQVFARYRDIRKVSTFGSARTPSDHPAYRQAHEFSRRLADLGFMVITG